MKITKFSICFFILLFISTSSCQNLGKKHINISNYKLININEAKSILNTIDTHLSIITQILQRNRILAIQSAYGIYTFHEHQILDLEFQELFKEIIYMKKHASLKERILFNDTDKKGPGSLYIKLGNTILDYPLVRLPADKFSISNWKAQTIYNELHVRNNKKAFQVIHHIDSALNYITYERSRINAFLKRLNYNIILKEILASHDHSKTRKFDISNKHLKNIEIKRELLNVIDIHLNIITQMLLHNRTLAVQSSNGYYEKNDHELLDLSFQEIYYEIARLRKDASYKGIILFDNKNSNWLKKIQIKLPNRIIDLTITPLPAEKFGLQNWNENNIYTNLHIRNAAHSNKMIKQIDRSLKFLAYQRGKIHAFLSRLNYSSELIELLADKIK